MTADERKELGLRIKKRRKELRLTQKELAERVHKVEGSIRQYENGLRTPDKTTLIAIANALSVDYHYLTGEAEYKSDSEYMRVMSELHDEADQIGEILKNMGIVTNADDKYHVRLRGENDSIDMNAVEWKNVKYHLARRLRSECENLVEFASIRRNYSDEKIGLKPDSNNNPSE